MKNSNENLKQEASVTAFISNLFGNVEKSVDLSTKECIGTYFSQILELTQSGEQFPVNLDDVWPLVYSEKGRAVKALKSNHLFLKDSDYKVLDQNDKQKGGGGHNKKTYMLSVPCLEFFIARKVRAVFEVYRHVFHQVIETKTLPIKRKHNRLTQDRMVDLLADVCQIEDKELRMSITNKLLGGLDNG